MKDKLLYLGRASLRIITREGKVIYIDPYAGNDYSESADLILITHEHFDHNDIAKIKNRNKNCQIIRSSDALKNGIYQKFDLGYVTVEAVEAGNNPNHNIKECVGFLLTLKSGITIYVSGDTSMTKMMESLSKRNIDYAFFCSDGIYNMDIEEASKCAQMVKAKHSIPYHIKADGEDFDLKKSELFRVDNKLILQNGEEIELIKS